MLTKARLQQCKQLLLTQQAEKIDQVEDHFGLASSHTDNVGELSSYDNHPGDMATEIYERGKDIALNEHTERELEAINEALHAIDQGTYGICRTCGRDIPFERLQAIPTTATCVEHAEDEMFTHNRPVEEAVISGHINPDRVEKESGYDAEDAWQEVSRYGSSNTPSDLFGDRDNYNEVYPNSDENIGVVEDVERYPDL